MRLKKNSWAISFVFSLVLTLFYSNLALAQTVTINGDNSLEKDDQATYYINPTGSTIFWSIEGSGGQINSGQGTPNVNVTAVTGASFVVRVQLDGGSSGFGGFPVSVTPPVPTASFTELYNNCNVTLDATGSNITGVTWYWQTSSSGTNTDLISDAYDFPASTNGTYFLRAKSADGNWGTGQWSVSSQGKSVTLPAIPGQATGSNPTPKCNSGTFNLTATPGSNGNTIRWYTAASGGTWLHTGTSYTTLSISNTTSYYAESYNTTTGCKASARKQIVAAIYPDLSSGGIITGTQTICQGGNPGILGSSSLPTGGSGTYTYQWQYSDNGSNWTDISSSNSATYDPTTSLSNSRWYRRRAMSCEQTIESDNTVKVTVVTASAPDVEEKSNSCGSNTIELNAVSFGIINDGTNTVEHRWYTTEFGPTLAPETEVSNIGSYVTGITVNSETRSFWVSAVINGCESAREPVTATYTPNGTTPTLTVSDVSTSTDRCGSGNFILAATGGSTGSVYEWYDDAQGNNHLHTGSSYSFTLNYANTTNGSKTYYVGGTLNNATGCPTTISPLVFRTVNVNPLAGDPTNAGHDSRCGPGEVTLHANTGTDGFGINWYDAQNQLVGSGNDLTINVSETTTFYAETYIQSTGCVSDNRMAVTATVTNAITWYLDADRDGYSAGEILDCENPDPVLYVSGTEIVGSGDCNDNNEFINPETIWFADFDNDLLGDPNDSLVQCQQPASYVLDNTDQCPQLQSGTNNCTPPEEEPGDPDPTDQNYIYTRTYQTERSILPDRKFDENEDDQYLIENEYLQSITYFDGLGRPKQQNAIRQSPDGKDIIAHIAYDGFGRKQKDWLPVYEPNGDIGSYRTDDMEMATKTYYKANYANDFTALTIEESNPYAETLFEASPLNRLQMQGAPGEDWKLGSGHEVEISYETNAAGEVRFFRASLAYSNFTYVPTLEFGIDENDAPIEFYPAGKLTKTIGRDENHTGTSRDNTTETFKDKQGRTVLVRKYEAASAIGGDLHGMHDTYYVYDDYGNLTYVLTPNMNATTEGTLAGIISSLDDLGYRYVYDHRNRLVEKKLPGKDWEYVVYNALDQPILTQDAEQRKSGEWLFTKYDAFGRVAYTGKASGINSLTRAEVQAEMSAFAGDLWVNQTESVDGSNDFGGTTVYYNNGAYPHNETSPAPLVSLTEVLTINYYDNYNTNRSGTAVSVNALGTTSTPLVMGLPTESKVKVLDVSPASWITSVSYYDDKARPIYGYSHNAYLATTDILETQLDFVGKPIRTKSSHTRNGATIVTIDNFFYDHTGRLTAQTQCIGNETLADDCTGGSVTADLALSGTISSDKVATNSITITDATLLPGSSGTRVYIDPNATGGTGGAQELIALNTYDNLGRLTGKKVGGPVNAILEQSAGLQDIQYAYNVLGWLKKINDPANLGSSLFGFEMKYNDIADTGKKLFNGNISQTLWATQSPNNTSNTVSTSYIYSYDALNRILNATDNTGHYNLTSVTYDKNGNITDLVRQGHRVAMPTSTDFGVMDDLEYSYVGNQLTSVSDASGILFGFSDGSTAGNDYDYDENGNLTQDLNKDIHPGGITYNHLNLPAEVKFGTANQKKITYIYDALGTKLKKVADDNGSLTETEYAGNFIYEGPSGNTQFKFFSQPEGYVSQDGQGGYEYVYQYRDHLGNIRLSYTDINRNNANPVSLEIVEENNYYPFGLKHNGYNSLVSTEGNDAAQRWKFGGKELDNSLNGALHTYDFGARNYDPALGRWMNMDPLAEQMRRHSPYNYVFDNPIFFTDPDGMVPAAATDGYGSISETASVGYAGPITEGDLTIARRKFKTSENSGEVNKEIQEEWVEEPGTVHLNEVIVTSKDDESYNNAANNIFEQIRGAGFGISRAIDYYNLKPYPVSYSGNSGALEYIGVGGIVKLGILIGDLKLLRRIKLLQSASKVKLPLPTIDATGKVHGTLPKVKDLANYSREELRIFLQDLRQSVQKRIKVTSKLGRDRSHGQRQGAEQDLIKSIEKYLGNN